MYEQQRQLVEEVITQMQICADMVGPRDESKSAQYGFVPGLDENELAKNLLDKITAVKSGIFQVMFTGCFNAGKSTLINALIKRDILRRGAVAETAVITKIFFNADQEKVVIYKRNEFDSKGKPITETMYDLREFFKEYRVDDKNLGKFLGTTNHVEIFLTTDGIAGSMVQFVDSPGTQASAADNEVSLKFIQHADAIVFLIHAKIPMDQFDKDFIDENFVNRGLKNVFFVVNHFNEVYTDDEREEVRQRIRNGLVKVFSDKHGNFNDALFNQRVFYVNALGSLNTRIGRETLIAQNISKIIPDEETGVPQFEEVLGEFLTSGDKDKIALNAYRSQMASIFVAAEKAVTERRKTLNRDIEENKEILLAYENDKTEIENEINAIRKAIENTERNILRDAKDAYDNFLTAIDSQWSVYFDADKKEKMQIGYWTLVHAHATKGLAFWRDPDARKLDCDQTTKEATQGFADGIRTFIEKRSDDMSQELSFKVKNNIAQLMTELSERQKNLQKLNMPVDIDEIIEKIVLERNIPIVSSGKGPNLGQAFVGLFFADPELISIAGGGNASTLDFIVQVIKVNIIDMILASVLFALIGNIFGIILFVFYKILKYFFTNGDLTDKLIAETKTTVLDGYKDRDGKWVCDEDGNPIFTGLRGTAKATFSNKISAVIHGIMCRTGNQIIDGINNNLAEVEENLSKTNEIIRSNDFSLRQETVRLNNILNKIADTISEISRLTDGTELDRNQIRSLAVKTQ